MHFVFRNNFHWSTDVTFLLSLSLSLPSFQMDAACGISPIPLLCHYDTRHLEITLLLPIGACRHWSIMGVGV